MSLIQAENLTKVYGKGETAVTALDHISLSMDAGEFVFQFYNLIPVLNLMHRWHPSSEKTRKALWT